MHMRMSFGQRLKTLRRDLDLSQSEIADLAGCSVNTIRKLEGDERRPSRELASQLADVFELQPPERSDFLSMARGTPSVARPTIPSPMTRLIGREVDVAAVRQRLTGSEARLLTLIGPPGVGKTRLALQVGTELQDVFREGAAFVPLAPIHDPQLVIEAIAQTLGVRGMSDRLLEQAVIEHLRNRQLLLVLDNFEHLFVARDVVGSLLAGAPRLRVLVTSRAALDVYGEHIYLVPTLGLPERDPPRRGRSAGLSAAEVLFLERARAIRPNFASDPAERQVVAQICRRLEGLPLALELAATRARSMGARPLLEQLGQRFRVLTAARGPTDMVERQRSVRGALDWSFDLLNAETRRLFGRLAVFSSGATLAAIEAVCGEGLTSVEPIVEALADQSLLQVSDVGDSTRFGMLETIRTYALERLIELEGAQQEEVLRGRHAAFFAQVAADVPDGVKGPGQLAWLRRLEADHDNLRAALAFAQSHGEARLLGSLSAGLWPFWRARGFFHEGRRWLTQTLDMGAAVPRPLRAAALNGAGVLALLQNEYPLAINLLTEARATYEEVGDSNGVAFALSNLGWVFHEISEYDKAQGLMQQSLEMRCALGDTWGESRSLNNLGVVALEREQPLEAITYFEASAALCRRADDALGLAQALSNLGWALQEVADYARAENILTESLVLARRLEDARAVAHNLSNLGLMALYRGESSRAGEMFADSLAAFLALGDRRGVAEALEGVAGVAAVQGRATEAARLFGAASALREVIGAPLLPADHSRYETLIGAAREQLTADAWERPWVEGRLASLDDVVNQVLG